MAQKQYPLQAQKYGNFCQVTLRIQKILTSSNQILNLGSLKTVHAVCASYILQTQNLLSYNLFYQIITIYFNIQILFQLKQIFVSLCVYGYVCAYIIMYLCLWSIWVCVCLHVRIRLCVCPFMCTCNYMCVRALFFLIPTSRQEA